MRFPKFKKGKKDDSLDSKYGVMKDIPEQEIAETEEIEVTEKKKKKNGDDSGNLELLLKIEKIEGKLSFMDEFKREMGERLSHISEEIGELRSSFLELDKKFTTLESKSEKAMDAVEEVQPEKVMKKFDKNETEIMKNQAELETIGKVLEKVRDDNKKITEILDKIKNLENIIKMFHKVEGKIKTIDEVRDHVDRVAGKSESMFSELGMKLKEFEGQKDKIHRLDELSIDMVRMLDEISMKMPKFIETEKAGKVFEEIFKKDINKNINKTIKEEIKKVDKRYGNEKKKMTQSINELNKIIDYAGKNMAKKDDHHPLAESNLVFKLNEKVEVYFNFFQKLQALAYDTSFDEVSATLKDLRFIIEKMRTLNLWNSTNKDLVYRIYSELMNSWESAGNHEIGEIFYNEIQVVG